MSVSAVPEVRFGEWITEGWRMFVEQWQVWVLMALVFFVTGGLPFIILSIVSVVFVIGQSAVPVSGPDPTATIFLLYGAVIVLAILMTPLYAYLVGGMYRTAIKQLKGGRIEVRDLFSAGDCFGSLLGASLIGAVMIFVGFLLCIIPGYIATALIFFATPLIVDRRLGAVEALRTSSDLIKQNLLMFTLFAFVTALIASVGSYICYIGILASYPLQFTIGAVAYRDCFGVPGARRFVAAPPQSPDYAASVQPPVRSQQWTNDTCPHCGATPLPTNSTFCLRCGKSLTE